MAAPAPACEPGSAASGIFAPEFPSMDVEGIEARRIAGVAVEPMGEFVQLGVTP